MHVLQHRERETAAAGPHHQLLPDGAVAAVRVVGGICRCAALAACCGVAGSGSALQQPPQVIVQNRSKVLGPQRRHADCPVVLRCAKARRCEWRTFAAGTASTPDTVACGSLAPLNQAPACLGASAGHSLAATGSPGRGCPASRETPYGTRKEMQLLASVRMRIHLEQQHQPVARRTQAGPPRSQCRPARLAQGPSSPRAACSLPECGAGVAVSRPAHPAAAAGAAPAGEQ